MIVKKRLNDTNYVLQKSARSPPFVVHVDCMRQFHSDFLGDGVQHPSHTSTPQASSLQLTGANKPTTQVDIAVGQAD